MNKNLKLLEAVLALGYFFLLSPEALEAQPFPAKAVELIVHTGPGGGSDLFARVVADIVNKERFLPQPLVVLNKPGGGGAVAFRYVAEKRGDPYTVLSVATTVFLTAPTRAGLDIGPEKFTPVALLGFDINVMAVREESPFKTLKDVVEAARRSPKAVTIGVGSIGATAHLLGYLIEKQTGVKFNFVPLKSGGEAVVGALGGHVQLTTENLSEMMPHVQAKKMRVLAVPTEKRIPYLTDVPTLKELGLPITLGLGRGLAGPADIPRETQAVLESAFAKAYKSSAWQDFAVKNMYDAVFMNGAEFGKYLMSRQPEMVQFVRDAGLAKK